MVSLDFSDIIVCRGISEEHRHSDITAVYACNHPLFDIQFLPHVVPLYQLFLQKNYISILFLTSQETARFCQDLVW
jgi:hypothetical protein